MTIKVNIAEAKAKLSALIEAAERGEEVIIARNGKPVARLNSVGSWPRRKPGILRELYGWTGPSTPYEAFAPEPEDAIDSPLFPGDPDS
jgi:prevent-host-death family protein